MRCIRCVQKEELCRADDPRTDADVVSKHRHNTNLLDFSSFIFLFQNTVCPWSLGELSRTTRLDGKGISIILDADDSFYFNATCAKCLAAPTTSSMSSTSSETSTLSMKLSSFRASASFAFTVSRIWTVPSLHVCRLHRLQSNGAQRRNLLNVHGVSACTDSYRQAPTFIRRRVPERSAKTSSCTPPCQCLTSRGGCSQYTSTS